MRGGQNRTSRYARPKMLCAGAPEDVVCRFCLEQGCLVRHDNALRAVSAAAVARGAQARRSRSRVPSFPASPGTEHSPDGVRLGAACCAQRWLQQRHGQQMLGSCRARARGCAGSQSLQCGRAGSVSAHQYNLRPHNQRGLRAQQPYVFLSSSWKSWYVAVSPTGR